MSGISPKLDDLPLAHMDVVDDVYLIVSYGGFHK